MITEIAYVLFYLKNQNRKNKRKKKIPWQNE